ncbi:hypothetical protein F4861DRAFT_384896 [Xylaria intraflava]|nr:hypothetical protein F4861DRAFT_384896 [Xylaria intraflava]
MQYLLPSLWSQLGMTRVCRAAPTRHNNATKPHIRIHYTIPVASPCKHVPRLVSRYLPNFLFILLLLLQRLPYPPARYIVYCCCCYRLVYHIPYSFILNRPRLGGLRLQNEIYSLLAYVYFPPTLFRLQLLNRSS